jgi:hypothetical protein
MIQILSADPMADVSPPEPFMLFLPALLAESPYTHSMLSLLSFHNTQTLGGFCPYSPSDEE